MPTPAETFEFLKQIHDRLNDAPLEPGDARYEQIYHEPDDPVWLMQRHVEMNGGESIQLFSGFRGSGKSTELLRLKKRLEDRGYCVLYADSLDYLNPSDPIVLTDFLTALAGAFSDALQALLPEQANLAHESFWTKFKNFLNYEITVKEAGAKAELSTPAKEVLGGLKAGVDVKFELKRPSNFRRNLQQFLINREQDLKSQIDQFIEDGLKLVRAQYGAGTRIVFIYDQLEQIRGTLQNEQDVFRSLERLFAGDFEMIKLPYVHAVYTIPPWLKFLLPGNARITVLPTPHLWHNDADRSRYESCWTLFRDLVRKRLGDDGIGRLFGADPSTAQALVDRLIGMSGGPFRDLLRLLRETVLRASDLPVSAAVVESVINNARNAFLPIAIDDAKWLAEIARIRDAALASTDAASVNRFARFIDNHFVLYFTNANEWYDVHPLVRDEIAKVVKASNGPQGG